MVHDLIGKVMFKKQSKIWCRLKFVSKCILIQTNNHMVNDIRGWERPGMDLRSASVAKWSSLGSKGPDSDFPYR